MHGITPAIPLAYTAVKKSSPESTRHDKTAITVRIEPDCRILKITGRVAWMLRQLVKAGPRGLTTLDLPPGVRAAHYVHMLRRADLLIESPRETHGGDFCGANSRYTLRTQVTVLEDCDT